MDDAGKGSGADFEGEHLVSPARVLELWQGYCMLWHGLWRYKIGS